ncbi:endonuclease/exonuclease/phosphatase family protein [Capnocytophaga canimorsus]|uniref:endonuclease/exonuclease/phosphatase family protein n=1 Tax=Capnocytophaga canimorsus TaxID=28188 RepID=UPI00384BE771
MKVFKNTLTYFGLLFGVVAQAQSVSVMSYNIRYDNPHDKENAWTQGDRKERVIQVIKEQNPDILGVQEALAHQVAYLEDHLSDYQFVGVGRDDGNSAGEYAAIFFNTNKFQLLDSGYFWLSETPEKPSKGWDATCCNRIATWVKLQMGKVSFYVFNTHFDHEGEIAQQESARLLQEKMLPLIKAKIPILLLGDLNITPDNKAIASIQTILKDTFKKEDNDHNATFNAFDLNNLPTKRIDYIFISKYLKSKNYRIIDKKINGLYPSDHFPITAQIKLR